MHDSGGHLHRETLCTGKPGRFFLGWATGISLIVMENHRALLKQPRKHRLPGVPKSQQGADGMMPWL